MASYPLNYEGISRISHEVSDFLKGQGVERKELLRTRLTIEELLMKYLEHFPDALPCELSLARRFGQLRILIKIRGASFDPQSGLPEEDSFYNTCMRNLDLAPTWAYRNGENRISLVLSKKRTISDTALNLGAIVLGLLLGAAAKYLASPTAQEALCKGFLDPVNNAVMGLLSGASIFFIFFSIMNGICSMGDMATFSRIGKQMFGRIIVIMLAATAAVCLLCVFVFPITSGGGSSFDAAGLWQMIVDIVPTNFVDPFLSGNALQVSFLSIVFGIIILILGEKGKGVASLISDVNGIIQLLLQGVIRCLPLPIFISIFELVLTGDLAELAGFFKYPLYLTAAFLVIGVFFLIFTAASQHISVGLLFKKIRPVALLAFITSSSAATISESSRVCEEKLGIEKQFFHVGWPINTSFIGVGISVDVIIGCMACAEFFNVPISFPLLITIGLNSCILGMATPKITGVMATVYTLLLGTAGIPAAPALALLMPFILYIDHIGTCVNCILVQTELVMQADKAGMLNKDILRSTENICS